MKKVQIFGEKNHKIEGNKKEVLKKQKFDLIEGEKRTCQQTEN